MGEQRGTIDRAMRNKRYTFSFKDKRRDQRRPISLTGTLGGIEVVLVDVSFSGIGGAIELRRTAEQPLDSGQFAIEVGEETTLEFRGPGAQQLTLPVTIRRIEQDSGAFGATFKELSSAQFDAIERLMFPRRRAVAYR